MFLYKFYNKKEDITIHIYGDNREHAYEQLEENLNIVGDMGKSQDYEIIDEREIL